MKVISVSQSKVILKVTVGFLVLMLVLGLIF